MFRVWYFFIGNVLYKLSNKYLLKLFSDCLQNCRYSMKYKVLLCNAIDNGYLIYETKNIDDAKKYIERFFYQLFVNMYYNIELIFIISCINFDVFFTSQ